MSRVKSADTQPELIVRRTVHRLGYRYRLHLKALPGTPDLVFGTRKKVIFVNGCFWHGHAKCKRARIPEANRDYWFEKIRRNRNRDRAAAAQLGKLGWERLTIWECQLKVPERVEQKIKEFLSA